MKKGLSDVVATVLIILLAIAAVIIVWALVRGTIRSAGSSVVLSERCLQTSVEPIVCQGTDVDQTRFVIQVKSGTPDEIILSIGSQISGGQKQILTLTKNDTNTTILGNPPSVPETFNFLYNWSSVRIVEYVEAVAVVRDAETGETRACGISPRLNCTRYVPGS